MDFTEKHFFIHAAPPVVVVVLPLFPLLHVLQFKRIGLRLDLLLWPGESPDSVCVCVWKLCIKKLFPLQMNPTHTHTRDAVAFIFYFFLQCSSALGFLSLYHNTATAAGT